MSKGITISSIILTVIVSLAGNAQTQHITQDIVHNDSTPVLANASQLVKKGLDIELVSFEQPYEDQSEEVQAYINTYFPHSPVTAEMITRVGAHYNIPAGFILAVGHNESHMGTKGRAVETMNPMNVGNTDGGDYKAVICGVANNCLSGWEEGLDQFASLISRCYFHEGEEIRLDTWIGRDFRAVRCGLEGKRYMTDVNSFWKYQERIINLNNFNIKY